MLFGWNVSFRDDNTKQQFLFSPKKICISAHSAPFIDGLLIHYALNQLYIPHIIYSKYLFIFTPSWCKDIPLFNNGFVKKESNTLNQLTLFCRVIFPSGGKIKWKSGFYHLAKNTNADLFVIGIDYKTKCVVIDSKLDINTSYENIKKQAIKILTRYKPSSLYMFLYKWFSYGCETYIKN